jgi:hypothetical protein
MEKSQVLRNAGDVNIEKVKVISSNGFFQDITNQVIAIQVFEDLFSPFITGSLIVKDSLDLINLFPFVGEEFVELKISTPTLKAPIEGKFYIFKMTDREMLGDRNVIYELHFITQEALVDLNKRLSKTFSGRCSDIANTLMTDKNVGLQLTRKLNIEETKNNTKFLSNFWNPVKCLNYVANTSLNKNNSPSYVFFENRAGFNFVSLESLYTNNDVIQEFVFDNYIRDDRKGGGNIKNIEEDYRRIREIHIPTAFDYMDRIRSGVYGSKQYSHDLTTKRFGSKNFDMLQSFQTDKHLNPYAMASKTVTYRYASAITTAPKYYSNFSGYGDTTNSNSIQKRVSLIKQADSNKIQLVVPGRTDYTVGQKTVVNLNRMEPISKNETDTLDRIFSGAYIIGAINHYIDREKHECTMELFKESLLKDLDGKK